MDNGSLSLPALGDGPGDALGDGRAAAGGAQCPPSPPPESTAAKASGVPGSRFWALAGEDSDEEADLESEVVASSPNPGPSQCVLGDFLDQAWSQAAGRKSGSARRRTAFVPGGRGPRRGQGGHGGAFVFPIGQVLVSTR